MKKLLLLAAAAGGGYVMYRQVMSSRAEDDLWSEATAAPDFSASYRSEEAPAVVEEVIAEEERPEPEAGPAGVKDN